MELDLNNPVWIEINLKALEHNYNYVRDAISNKTKLAAVVKANAYGHGVDKISQKLNELGTEYFCVGSPYEGIELRESGIKKPIFVLAEALEFQYHDIIEADLIQTVASWRSILALNQFAKKNNKLIKVQLIIDTGMGRIGFLPEQVFNIYKKTKKLDNIIIKGIFSHFARADSANKEFSKKQFNLLVL